MSDSDRRAQWLSALGAVVALAAVFGSILGGFTYGAARLAGLAGADPGGDHSPSSRPRAAAELVAGRPTEPDSSTQGAARTEAKADRAERRADHRARNRSDHRSQHRRHTAHKARHRHEHGSKHKARHRQRHHRAHAGRRLTLAASTHRVHRMGRVHLSGRYPGHGGTRLVVQRFKGGRWGRFPVTVTVRGGRFRTWVASGYRGPNRFRVVDPGTHRASAPVTVIVR